MIMAALSLVTHTGELTEEAIRTGLKGNICRCTGYQNIVDAVLAAASELQRQA
jgi:carbon-monoxide dehydrogenase small subunit